MKKYQKYIIVCYLWLLFFFLLFIQKVYLESIPHVPDDAAYLFMAKIFASGQIAPEIPVSPEHFDFFPGILSVEKGNWLFQYPFGHPILLSVGVLFGIPYVIPPLIGTLVVLFIFLIAKNVYDLKTAYIASFLPVLSPFFLQNASSFMSHNSSAFYLLLALFCFVLYFKNKNRMLLTLLCGFFLGMFFATRPLSAVPFIALFFFFLLLMKPNSQRMQAVVFFCIGGFVPFSWWLLYNAISTGNPFVSQYFTVNKGLFGFDQHFFLDQFFRERITNVQILFKNLLPMLFNLPLLATVVLLSLPAFVKKKNVWDLFFLLSLFTLPVVYFFYNGTFLMYGPRFWYEILPFIFLLTARGLAGVFTKFPKTVSVSVLVIFLYSFGRLFSFLPTVDPDANSPLALERLKGFNYTNASIQNTIAEAEIHNAVVLVADCQGNWWCFGSVFSQNNPTLTTDIIYAKDLGDQNRKLFQFFPTRTFYKIDYYTNHLEEYNMLK